MKNNQNKINLSIIMTVYNSEKYIGESIESILTQTYKDFEFIIIDDASTDNSYSICEQYSKKDSRIRLYRNKTNKWISYTRNLLIEKSKTDYIAIQDSDDISLPDRLELLMDFLSENKDYAIVSGHNIIIDSDGKAIGKRKYGDNIQNIILKKNPLSQPSCMFRKDIFREVGWYDETIDYGEDYDLWLRFYAAWYKIKNLDSFLIEYRIHDTQSKKVSLKKTLRNTIKIQNRAISKYGITASISDKFYHLCEKLLLLLPDSFILFLFKNLEYKKEK